MQTGTTNSTSQCEAKHVIVSLIVKEQGLTGISHIN